MSKSDKTEKLIQQYSSPLDTIIDFAWASGADRFWVNNAKDELKTLRRTIEECKDGSSAICQKLDQ